MCWPTATPRRRWRRSGRPRRRYGWSGACGSPCSPRSATSASRFADGVIEAYAAVVDKVDLDSIAARERTTRHDVKARIDEFVALAGHEQIHKGMTSRDLTENVEQLQIRASLELIRDRVVSALARLATRALEFDSLVMVGRSHNVPAQATTLGKRFATAAEELLIAYDRIAELLERYPLRGVKGPMGTAADQLDLLGDEGKVAELERAVARHLGFSRVLTSVGQVYPRSLDFDVVSALAQAAAAPSSLATTIRLMAGQELATEGFRAGQVGSSAMPHKMNTRSCERINGLAVVIRGYLSMAGEIAGDQWNEGDVSCSVVRRVALPGAFFALDGLFLTLLTVLDEFSVFPAVVARELDRYLPFLATTKILVAATRRGVGRESAHEAIREHAVAVALAMRQDGNAENDLFEPTGRGRPPGPEPGRDRRARPRPIGLRGCRVRTGRCGRRPGRRGGRAAPRRRHLRATTDSLSAAPWNRITAGLTAFVLIVPVELPDKTFVATLVLATRYRPLPVWLGVVAAFGVQCAIAVAAGGLLTLLPETPVQLAAAALFAVGAVILFHSARRAEADEADAEREYERRIIRHPQRLAGGAGELRRALHGRVG